VKRPFVLTLLLCILSISGAEPTQPAASQDGIDVYFSPDGGAGHAVVKEIAGAKTSLDIAAYSYTHAEISKATVEAHKRGIRVRVVMDKTQSAGKYSSATFLHNSGVPVWIDVKVGLMHNKYLIIDGQTIITGSFNLTKSADERNAENLLLIRGKEKLTQAYAENFKKLLQESERYKPE